MTLATYKTHLPTSSTHAGNIQRFLQGLYGKKLPMAIGEWGYGMYEQAGQGNTYPEESAAFFKKEMVDACLAMNYIGLNYWHQMNLEQTNSCAAAGWGGFGNRQSGANSGYLQDDPKCVAWGTDARRKSFAAMFARDEVIGPFRGPGVKPINPQHA
jgi:hypothetical protein